MNKTLKIFAVILMAMILLFSSTQMAFAANAKTTTTDGTDTTSIVESIQSNITGDTDAATDLTNLAGKIIGLIQIASAVAAVILIAVFGFKFILGSASEKADYQKSFIPLIVGVVVVFAATSIAKLLFGLIG